MRKGEGGAVALTPPRLRASERATQHTHATLSTQHGNLLLLLLRHPIEERRRSDSITCPGRTSLPSACKALPCHTRRRQRGAALPRAGAGARLQPARSPRRGSGSAGEPPPGGGHKCPWQCPLQCSAPLHRLACLDLRMQYVPSSEAVQSELGTALPLQSL